jgi:hypothetical protein
MKRSLKFLILTAVMLSLAVLLAPTRVAMLQSAGPQSRIQLPDNEPTPSAQLRNRKLNQPNLQTPEGTIKPEKDDPFSRMLAEFESRGATTAPAIQKHIREARSLREQYPERFTEGRNERNIPNWISLGPTSDDFIQNGVTLHEIDSGRLRTILPHPTEPNIVYVLSSGGGLWKSTNFTSRNHKWRPLTDSIGTTAGGAVAFGRDPDTLYFNLESFIEYHE